MASTEISVNSQILEELNTKEARELHETINNLRASGVDKVVNLPQIIVVGDQSSGKSSVLEALSHVRFPVKDGLCTRFATELVLHQAVQTSVKATIRYFDQTKVPRIIEQSGFDEKDLPDIIQEAKEHMGTSITDKGFSQDVLRLEISGPKLYPLTLIDLPGLFYGETDTQSLAGKEVVDDLVLDYMSKKESIILTVITANQPLANHDALTRVKMIDPSRERTIGVITKPDLIVASSRTEAEYVKLVKNEEGANKLLLGWHALRNRGEMETDLEGRDAVEEQFFKTGVWASVSRQSLGIFSLRKKLSRVLYDHIRINLPQVIANIQKSVKERQNELERLGKPRPKVEDMRSFLITVASDFQSLAKDGIDGRYDDPFFGSLESENYKLRAQLRNYNRAFQHILWTKGASRTIIPDNNILEPAEAPPDYLQEFLQKYPYDFPTPVRITASAVNLELQRQGSINQGKEFPGISNKHLAIKLFKEQAKPWKSISQSHIECVTLVAKAFVDAVFEHIVGPANTNKTTEAILSTCVDGFFADKDEVLREKLDELLRPYQDGYNVMLDAEFHAAFSQNTTDRIADCLYKIFLDSKNSGNVFLTKNVIKNAIKDDKQLNDGDFGTQTVVDMMLIFYEASRRTFAVNVINLAIESCLIAHIPEILTPTKVAMMSNEQLAELAKETDDIIDRRNQLLADIAALQDGLDICQRYKPRGVTVLPSVYSRETTQNTVNTQGGEQKLAESLEKSEYESESAASNLSGQTPKSDSTSIFEKIDGKSSWGNSRIPLSKHVEIWNKEGCYPYSEKSSEEEGLNVFQHICLSDNYRGESPEEMRLWSYTPAQTKV